MRLAIESRAHLLYMESTNIHQYYDITIITKSIISSLY